MVEKFEMYIWIGDAMCHLFTAVEALQNGLDDRPQVVSWYGLELRVQCTHYLNCCLLFVDDL